MALIKIPKTNKPLIKKLKFKIESQIKQSPVIIKAFITSIKIFENKCAVL